MIDMKKHIQPRSDQTNADDFISGPQTIKITKVTETGNVKQPINIDYEGGEGRPYKPNLSMMRVLALGWGEDGHAYVAKSMTLFREPTVRYGGAEQGGIRISHMSDLEKPIRTMLTITRGKREAFTVQPLVVFKGNPLPTETLELWKQEIERAQTMADLQNIGLRVATNKYDEAGSLLIRAHYQVAQERIRADVKTEVDPKNAEFPPEETTSEPGSLEGDVLPDL